VGGHGRRTIQTLEPHQMSAIVNDGDGHSPVVFERFRFGRRRYGLDVCELQHGFCFHGVFTYLIKNRA
jgi:hypothetical protein